MKNIVIFGYGYLGYKCYLHLSDQNREYNIICFADNSLDKQGKNTFNHKIISMDELEKLHKERDLSCIIASNYWAEIGLELEKHKIPIEGIWIKDKMEMYSSPMTFDKLNLSENIKLYAGDICDEIHLKESKLYGLSINKMDSKHIRHDITLKYPLPDSCISSYEAEDVLEHIEFEKVLSSINEIYRILKKGALFRICLPDYYSPFKKMISMKDENNQIVFDPSGGGRYDHNKVVDGGHVWFPNYDVVNKILQQSEFKQFDFLCYHTKNEELVMKKIDYSQGYVNRLENVDRIYSMIVDCIK